MKNNIRELTTKLEDFENEFLLKGVLTTLDGELSNSAKKALARRMGTFVGSDIKDNLAKIKQELKNIEQKMDTNLTRLQEQDVDETLLESHHWKKLAGILKD